MNGKGRKLSIGRLIITLFTLAIVIVGGTYAWLSYQSNKSALVLSIGDINDSKVIIKPYQIRETMVPVNTYTSGVYSTVEAINNGSSSISLKLYYKVNQLDEILKNNGLKYTIASSTSENVEYTEVVTGDFVSIDENNEKVILETKISGKTTIYYRVYLWLDSSVGNQTALQNTKLDVELNGVMQQEVSTPEVMEGMIPVIIENDGTVTTISKDNKDWYDYGKQRWANAILVTESSRSNYLNKNNVEVNPDDILAYYVWIPRYRYKIWETGVSSTGKEQPINIVFEDKDTPKSTGTTIGSYRTHPAFTFGGLELNGIWVGKFETSTDKSSTCYTDASTDNCNNTNQSPRILPNVSSLRYQSVSNQFQTALKFSGGTLSNGKVTFTGNNTYGLTANTDSHMMKNSEWGAVAYLSHSDYGINKEVRINNNSSYATGCGASVENGTSTSACQIKYGEAPDYPQSTTGNITGVYDMSGGALEYVLGVFADENDDPRSGNSTEYNSGFNGLLGDGTSLTSGIAFPTDKYYDLYTTDVNSTACGGGVCYGHALSETTSWYGDYGFYVSSESPWFRRGGSSVDGAAAGVFYSSIGTGVAANTYSFRSVLVPIQTYQVTYEANVFGNVTNKTSNGLTISYDGSTSNLTLNGTLTSSTTIATFLPMKFVAGEQYKISLTYVSGTVTNNASNSFAFDVHKGGANLSTRNYKSLHFPTSGTNSTILTISDLAATDGEGLRAWIWPNPNKTADVFTNYVVKVVVTKVETTKIDYRDKYVLPANPARIGYTFTGWYTAETGGTKITNDTLMTRTSNHTLYAQWRINKVYINYHVNGGTVTASTTSAGGTTYKWTTSNSIIYLNGEKAAYSINYGASTSSNGLSDYDNPKYLNITKTGYTAVDKAEWKCMSGCTTSGKTYDDHAVYAASDFCDASKGDCTVVVGVNWRINKVYINYHVNGGTITASTTSAGGTVYKWTTSNSIIYLNGTKLAMGINYGNSSDLPNYNNTKYMNITRTGYSAPDGAEWKCMSGCTTSGKTYDHDVAYAASDFCDASKGDCTVVVGVNWKQSFNPVVSYSCANGNKGTSPYSFTYTGNCSIINDGSGNWRVKFLTSGTFKPSASLSIDVFLVGGGGGGGAGYTWWNKWGELYMGGGGGGGGGGYTKTSTAVSIKFGTSYTITIGAGGAATKVGGSTTAFGLTAAGGNAGGKGKADSDYPNGGGGSAGTGGNNGGRGGGDDGSAAAGSSCSIATREFGSSTNACYAGGGGGGGHYNGYIGNSAAGSGGSGGGGSGNSGNGIANTGGGGGGGIAPSGGGTITGGSGGSGIVIIRNKR